MFQDPQQDIAGAHNSGDEDDISDEDEILIPPSNCSGSSDSNRGVQQPESRPVTEDRHITAADTHRSTPCRVPGEELLFEVPVVFEKPGRLGISFDMMPENEFGEQRMFRDMRL